MINPPMPRLFPFLLMLLTLLPVARAYSAPRVQTFDIWEYRVKGNSLLSSALIESALYPFLGPAKTIDSVEQASEYLQQLYKQHGYPIVVVKIPEQDVIGGVVTLQVVEGKIDRTKISGNHYFSRRELRKELPSLQKGQPLNMVAVRQEIDDLNSASSYRSVTPVIRPGRYPGTMEMELKVRDELPAWVYMEANNRHTALTTDNRTTLGMGYDNLWQKNHAISLSYTTAPEDPEQTTMWNLSYSMPLSPRSRLSMFAMDSDSRVDFASSGDNIQVNGVGTMIGVRNARTLSSSRNDYHVLVLGMDYKDFEENVTISNEDDTAQVPIPIDYLAFTLSYNLSQRTDGSLRNSGLSANFGVRGLGNSEQEFDYKRYLSRANYFYVGASFNQDLLLSQRWKLSMGLHGQYSESPLISNEQLSAGGAGTVRGYTESVVLGDYGAIGNLELFYQPPVKKSWLNNMYLSAYVDSARLYVHDSLTLDAGGGILDQYRLMGAGVGFGMQAFKKMNLSLYYAKALEDLDQDGFSNDPMLHFSLSAKF